MIVRLLHYTLLMFSVIAANQCCIASELPKPLREVRFDQKLDEQVPLDLRFTDDAGRAVRLGDYFHEKPVILVMAYYRCPMLCTQVLNGLVRGLFDVSYTAGQEFEVVVVSFDSREGPEMAAAKKKTYVQRYGRAGAEEGWHFLTGNNANIERLAESIGFHYTYDDKRDEFAHASGILILTPEGKISRYFYDIQYPGRDLRLGLVEASEHKIGSPVEQILLFCFHYDPTAGKYGAAIMNLVRLGGLLTFIALVLFIRWLLREDRRRTRRGLLAIEAGRLTAADGQPSEFGGSAEGLT